MRADQFPDDPEIVATLEAIDATLAGEAVDPRHAELAELALLLAADRPVMDPAFAVALDEGVQRRSANAPRRARRGPSWWVWAPASAVAASLAVAIVIVVGQGGSGPGIASGPRVGTLDRGVASSASGAAAPPKVHRALSPQAPPVQNHGVAGTASALQAQTLTARVPSPVSAPAETLGPFNGPPTAGRKVIQGAQLSLSTSSNRVGQVAQEVYNVIDQQKGIVKSSRVTSNGGAGGYAEFQLAVPSGGLAATLGALSELPYARVASRTDTSQDVTNQYRVVQRQLADDRALRTSLLRQLASAVTQVQIDSLNARIHDAEAAISRDEAALHSLNRSVGFSQIYVTVSAGAMPVPVQHGAGGFTLSRAVHDAGKVLTTAAGVALIALAALLPVGLVAALLWWLAGMVRRRRRLQALDLS